MSNVLKFEISNLFHKHNFSIDFMDKLNVLVGENGCGKSTIINIIYNLSKKNFVYLSKLQFDELTLNIENQKIKIKYEDLQQIELSKNPDFRENLFTIDLDSINSFDEFYDKVLKMNKQEYPFCENNYLSENEYLDDDKYYSCKEYIDFMSKYKLIYGSKMYLKCFYAYFKNENPFEILENIVSNIQLYSFVDIEDTDCIKIHLNNETEDECVSYLSKYFTDKAICYKNGKIIFKDNETSFLLEEKDLSSGERKIIKIMELIVSAEENDFLLLDEPELSLSIYWQRFIIEDLIEHCKAKKIIIATQSPNLLNGDELDYLIPIYSDECI